MKDAIVVEIDPKGALKVDREPFAGEITTASLKAKFQALRDRTGRKTVLLISDISKPQRVSAFVFEAADALGLSVTPGQARRHSPPSRIPSPTRSPSRSPPPPARPSAS